MAFRSGSREVGEDAVPLCLVTDAGVRVRNEGSARVYLGGPDVSSEGYPLDPGTADEFRGPEPHESPVVPAPADDLAGTMLYARTAEGAGTTRVAWIGGG